MIFAFWHLWCLILVENGEILSNDKLISECFNEDFTNVTDTLNITTHDNISDISISIDPIVNAINKYVQHPSILLIREHTVSSEPFCSSPVYSLDVLNVNALNSGKRAVDQYRQTCLNAFQEFAMRKLRVISINRLK